MINEHTGECIVFTLENKVITFADTFVLGHKKRQLKYILVVQYEMEPCFVYNVVPICTGLKSFDV